MPSEPPTPTISRPALTAGAKVATAVLIAVPFVALLWVPSYARATPRLWGFPFFYWYQLLWVFLSALTTWLAYLIVSRGRTAADDTEQASAGEEAQR